MGNGILTDDGIGDGILVQGTSGGILVHPPDDGILVHRTSDGILVHGTSDGLLVNGTTGNSKSSGGRCPKGACDLWELTIVTMGSGGEEAGGLGINAELRTKNDSCTDMEHYRRYRFFGLGGTAGIPDSLLLSVTSRTFSTECVG